MTESTSGFRDERVLLPRFLRAGMLKKAAKGVERTAKRALLALLGILAAGKDETAASSLRDISRILVIRPNYRIGNAIISTAIIAPLKEKYPGAAIDFLATDKTAGLFANLPVSHVAALSRSVIFRPWRAVSLIRGLRANRYDLAVQLEQGSLTGLLIARLVGARYVMGKPGGRAGWYDINVWEPIRHVYDTSETFARALGMSCQPRPQLVLSHDEEARAARQLRSLGLQEAGENGIAPFVAVFVGGHADKICPLPFWIELSRGLARLEQRFVVFVGPEETAMVAPLERALQPLRHGTLCHPRSLREFAAMLARASLVVTPDSGPMHLAAALGVPVVVTATAHRSRAFVPKNDCSRVVWNLDVSQALAAVREITGRQPVDRQDGGAAPAGAIAVDTANGQIQNFC